MIELMESFDVFFNESLKYYNGILQEDVSDTLEHIRQNLLPMLRITQDDIAFIGSAGKRKPGEESHNVNMAIDIEAIMSKNGLDDKATVEDFLKNQIIRLKYDFKIIKDRNRIIIEWPIKGNVENGCVELHIQLSENLEWIKFSRFAPNLNETNSLYSGKHREFFLESIISAMEKKVVNYFKEDVVKEYEKYELIFDEGLTKVRKSFEGKNGYLKVPRVIEESRRLITNDPDKFAEIIFGENYDSDDILTFEQCLDIFNSQDFKLSKKREKIKKIFKNKLSGLAMVVPEGLM